MTKRKENHSSSSPEFRRRPWGFFLAAVLGVLVGCAPEVPPLPPLEGPLPRKVPLPAESPVMNFRLEKDGRVYGQNSLGWLICWDRVTGRTVWEVQSDALGAIPFLREAELVLQTWSGKVEVRDLRSGSLRWSVKITGVPLLSLDWSGEFYRLQDGLGRLVLLDPVDGFPVWDRPAPQSFRVWKVEQWRADHPWITDIPALVSLPPAPREYPPVSEDLVDWLTGRGRNPEDLLFFPPEQDLVGIRQAREENPVLFTAWKAGVYSFSSPTLDHIPLKISLKDFDGAEMDSNMGYGDIRPEVSWKLKKGEPVLLDLVLINPEHIGQDVVLRVQVK